MGNYDGGDAVISAPSKRFELAKAMNKQLAASIHVAAVVQVKSFDKDKMTVDVQPLSKRLEQGESRLLKVSLPQAIGHLHLLWFFALDFAPDGDLSAVDAEEIADAALWTDDPSQFLDALISSGFVDREADAVLLHEWEEYGGKTASRMEKDRKRKADKGKNTAPDGIPAEFREDSSGVPAEQSQPSDGTPPLVHLHVHDWTTRIGMVPSFESLAWTRRAQDYGEFVLMVNYTDELAHLLQKGRVIEKSDDNDAMIIEDIRIIDGDEKKIHCSGRSVLSLLNRRIVLVDPTYAPPMMTGTNAGIIGTMLQRHAIEPHDPARELPVLYNPLPGLPDEVLRRSVSWRKLGDACLKRARVGGFGIRSRFNDGRVTVQLYPIEKIQPVFSKSRGTLSSQELFQSMREFANFVVVGGEGEYPNRTIATAGNSGSGINLFEKFLNVSSEMRKDEFGDGYVAALEQAGIENLIESAGYDEFTATSSAGNLVYKQDYDIGNIAAVQTEFGFDVDRFIPEITENHKDGRMELSIVFAPLTFEQEEDLDGGI